MARAPHPYADIFPMMNATALRELTASINKEGLHEPIITFEGKVLDGRNRQIACSNAKVQPVYKRYTGKDPLAYVMAKNLTRRHLTASQRAMVAAKMANLKVGSNKTNIKLKAPTEGPPSQDHGPISQPQAAATMNVGTASVERAKRVIASGNKDLIDAVESGAMPVATAAKQISQKTKPAAPTATKGEAESQRLLKLWDNTGTEGRALFLKGIGASTDA